MDRDASRALVSYIGVTVERYLFLCKHALLRHLQRLQDSAKALAFEAVPSSEDVATAIMTTLAANGMRDGAHARVTLTRGRKTTASMNPKFNVFGYVLYCKGFITDFWW